MKLSTTFVAVACLSFFLIGCKEQKKAAAPAESSSSSGNPLSAPADYVGALGKAQKSAQKTVGTTGLDQAVKTFFAEEGRYPKSLDELKSKGVPVPAPPAGMKWDYDPNTGRIQAVPQ